MNNRDKYLAQKSILADSAEVKEILPLSYRILNSALAGVAQEFSAEIPVSWEELVKSFDFKAIGRSIRENRILTSKMKEVLLIEVLEQVRNLDLTGAVKFN